MHDIEVVHIYAIMVVHFFYNSFIAALDGNRGYMNSSELIQACNQAKLHNYKI